MAKQAQPPTHLRRDTKKWWRSVANDYYLESHHLRLLTRACELWDLAEECREKLVDEGSCYTDRFDQPKPNPRVQMMLAAVAEFRRVLRELALDCEAPTEAYSRPPQAPANANLRMAGG